MKHEWKAHHQYIPGEPDEWFCYCDICGAEKDDDSENEECEENNNMIEFKVIKIETADDGTVTRTEVNFTDALRTFIPYGALKSEPLWDEEEVAEENK